MHVAITHPPYPLPADAATPAPTLAPQITPVPTRTPFVAGDANDFLDGQANAAEPRARGPRGTAAGLTGLLVPCLTAAASFLGALALTSSYTGGGGVAAASP